jgi:peptidoglycan/LPS O-acetylase OafA/YrhL
MTTNPRHARTALAPEPPAAGIRARIIGLDGARGLSCLGVAVMHITAHYSPHTAATYKTNIVGMSLIFFYVLSGFLLFLPYVRNLTTPRTETSGPTLPSTKNFALHRIARILPGYIVIFLLVNFVLQTSFVKNPVLQTPGTDEGVGMITDPGQLLANLTLTQSYIPAYFQTGINTSWSLTLEYAFYALLPILCFGLFALRKRTGLKPLTIALVGAGALIALGFIGRLFIPIVNAHTGIVDPALLDWGPNWGAVFSRTLLTNADNFAVGMLAAVAFVAMEQRTMSEAWSRRVRLISTVALLPMLVLTAALIALKSPYGTSALGAACALGIMLIVAPLARGEDSPLARLLDIRPIRFVGKVSLSAYLWHYPLMLLLGRFGLMAGDTLPGMLQNTVVVLAVTLVVSAVTYYLVEEPVMKAAKRYRHKWA